MKKITNKTRIKVHRSIGKEFGISFWNGFELRYYLGVHFDLAFTSKRFVYDFYKPTCEYKLMLFMIQYSNYIKNK